MNAEKHHVDGLLKIGELAKASGVSLSTVKYYVKEGLIHPSCKTGRNMAYYDPGCVASISLIRTLQKERYYPLSVIKRILESADVDEIELELLDAIHKVDHNAAPGQYTPGEAAQQSGLSAAQLSAICAAGLVSAAEPGKRHVYSGDDLAVMKLIRRRMDAGIPFAQSVRAFTIYACALQEAAQADVDAFTAGAMMVPDFDAEAGANMIRISDETLDAFVGIKRKEYNRRYGSQRLGDLDRFSQALDDKLHRLAAVLEKAGLHGAAAQCAAVLDGIPTGIPALDEAAGWYRSIGSGSGDIAGSIASCARSREYFASLRPEAMGNGAVTAWCLKLSWLTLAPEILACRQWARQGWEEFYAFPGRSGALPPELPEQIAGILLPGEEANERS